VGRPTWALLVTFSAWAFWRTGVVVLPTTRTPSEFAVGSLAAGLAIGIAIVAIRPPLVLLALVALLLMR